MLKNSITTKPLFNFIDHLIKEPTPLPILEFLDFLEIGKLAFKKTQILTTLKVLYFNFNSNFKYFFIILKYIYSNLQHFNTTTPKLPNFKLLFFIPNQFLPLNERCSIKFNFSNLKLKQIN